MFFTGESYSRRKLLSILSGTGPLESLKRVPDQSLLPSANGGRQEFIFIALSCTILNLLSVSLETKLQQQSTQQVATCAYSLLLFAVTLNLCK